MEGTESVMETAIRETKEKTGLVRNADYDVSLENEVYFEYKSSKTQTLKHVHLWPAELKPGSEVDIKLSPEYSDYAWKEYYGALNLVKKEYKVGLVQGDLMIRSLKQLPTMHKYTKKGSKQKFKF